jgi:hypothetical protein
VLIQSLLITYLLVVLLLEIATMTEQVSMAKVDLARSAVVSGSYLESLKEKISGQRGLDERVMVRHFHLGLTTMCDC